MKVKRYALEGCRLEIGTPTEVGRAAGHFWFPTLHPLGGRDVLCEVVLTEDKAQGRWPAVLYLSRDGGQTWQEAGTPHTYGPSSVLLEPGRLLLMPYELWPLTPRDRRNAVAEGTLVTLGPAGVLATEPTSVKFLSFPSDLADYHEGELYLLTNGDILELPDGRLFSTVYGRLAGDDKYTNFAVTSDDGGLTWHYLATVAAWQDVPEAPEGPDESNTVLLSDGRLMCVYRVGSGREHAYHKSYSADQGSTWTRPQSLAGAWSVEPQLVRLENGLLLLSGGRPGLFLWVCTDGIGEQWQPINLAAHHNATVADPGLHYAEESCAAGAVAPAQSTSYTGMLAVGPDEVLVCYDRLANAWSGAPGPWGATDAVLCARVRAEPTA